MTQLEASHVLYACFGFVSCLVLWSFGWRRWALDAFRQDLYAARDRLFDIAVENPGGSFSFSHPAYGQLRRQFHGAIRFAHRVSSIRVLVFLLLRSVIGPKLPIDVVDRAEMLKEVDCSAQTAVEEAMKLWDRAVMLFLVRTSPLFIFCVALAVVGAVLKAIFKMMLQTFVLRFTVKQASASFSSVVWTEVAMADAMEDQREEDRLTRHGQFA